MNGISTPRAEPMKLSARIRAAEVRLRRQQIEASGYAEQLQLAKRIGGMHQQRAQQASDKANEDLAATEAELAALKREQLIRVQEDTQQPISDELQDVIDRATVLGHELEALGAAVAQAAGEAAAITNAGVSLCQDAIGARGAIQTAMTDAILRTLVRPLKMWRIGPQPQDREQEVHASAALRRAAQSLMHFPPRRVP